MSPVVRRALLSVSDKTGLIEFARALAQRNSEILSTRGTARLLAENGIAVREVASHTGFPEIMDGRVKTRCIRRSTADCSAAVVLTMPS